MRDCFKGIPVQRMLYRQRNQNANSFPLTVAPEFYESDFTDALRHDGADGPGDHGGNNADPTGNWADTVTDARSRTPRFGRHQGSGRRRPSVYQG